MSEDLVKYEVEDPVAIITLNRPKQLNALTYPVTFRFILFRNHSANTGFPRFHQMLDALRKAISDAEDDPRVVGIVISGEGRGFCAGLDADVLVDRV
jgi:2-(1,2-epoxy-1,2-dihydrophenyl)acetyl-CoA isomerase